MALMRTEEPAGRLSPTQSVQQYQGQVLSGGTSGQPLPRQVMQTTTPKVPYSAKTGSGAMPSTDPNNIFSTVRPKSSPALNARKQKVTQSGTGGSTSYSGKSYSTATGPVGARGAYGLEKGAGTRLQALQGAYRKQFGTDLPVISGGRTFQEQTALYNSWLAGKGNLAAKPGTSKHETGRAVDFGGAAHSGGTAQHSWLAANAPNFGWHWAGKNFGEAWHFEAMY